MPLLRFIPETTNVDFVGWRWYAFGADGLLMVLSIVAMLYQGFNLGIDFTGGVRVEAKAAHTITEAELGTIRAELAGLRFGETQVQYIGGNACDKPVNSCVQIRVQPHDVSGGVVTDRVRRQLGSAYTIRNTEVIGPKISGELFQRGVLATVLAVLVISIYVWFRFEWQFGVGAVISTVHDVIMIVGLYVLLGLEFNLSSIAAILTVIGYSINDTVVIYDRIREMLRRYKRMPLDEVINIALNQTLSRTILTGLTVLLALTSLYFFGGEVISSFVFAIIIGVFVGTYSSVFIAGPVLILFKLRPEMFDREGDVKVDSPVARTPIAPTKA